MEENLRNVLFVCAALGSIFTFFGFFGLMLGPTPASPNNREAGAWMLGIGVLLWIVALTLGHFLGPTG